LCPSGLSVAKPSADHIPLGGFVHSARAGKHRAWSAAARPAKESKIKSSGVRPDAAGQGFRYEARLRRLGNDAGRKRQLGSSGNLQTVVLERAVRTLVAQDVEIGAHRTRGKGYRWRVCHGDPDWEGPWTPQSRHEQSEAMRLPRGRDANYPQLQSSVRHFCLYAATNWLAGFRRYTQKWG
jgi:hypothetical protein